MRILAAGVSLTGIATSRFNGSLRDLREKTRDGAMDGGLSRRERSDESPPTLAKQSRRVRVGRFARSLEKLSVQTRVLLRNRGRLRSIRHSLLRVRLRSKNRPKMRGSTSRSIPEPLREDVGMSKTGVSRRSPQERPRRLLCRFVVWSLRDPGDPRSNVSRVATHVRGSSSRNSRIVSVSYGRRVASGDRGHDAQGTLASLSRSWSKLLRSPHGNLRFGREGVRRVVRRVGRYPTRRRERETRHRLGYFREKRGSKRGRVQKYRSRSVALYVVISTQETLVLAPRRFREDDGGDDPRDSRGGVRSHVPLRNATIDENVGVFLGVDPSGLQSLSPPRLSRRVASPRTVVAGDSPRVEMSTMPSFEGQRLPVRGETNVRSKGHPNESPVLHFRIRIERRANEEVHGGQAGSTALFPRSRSMQRHLRLREQSDTVLQEEERRTSQDHRRHRERRLGAGRGHRRQVRSPPGDGSFRSCRFPCERSGVRILHEMFRDHVLGRGANSHRMGLRRLRTERTRRGVRDLRVFA